MFAMVMCTDVLVKSNFLLYFIKIIGPILEFFQVPKELLPLAIMRPISGSSSLILMNNILVLMKVDILLLHLILQGI